MDGGPVAMGVRVECVRQVSQTVQMLERSKSRFTLRAATAGPTSANLSFLLYLLHKFAVTALDGRCRSGGNCRVFGGRHGRSCRVASRFGEPEWRQNTVSRTWRNSCGSVVTMKPAPNKNINVFISITPVQFDVVRSQPASIAQWRAAFAEGDL